jgi:FAD synthetase
VKVDADSLPIVSTPLLPSAATSLIELCRVINERVSLFLAEDALNERLRSVQEQTKISLSVIREALERYSYVNIET